MKKEYLSFDESLTLLREGCEIFTDRGFGGAPYSPLFFRLYDGDLCKGEIHHATIKKLIAYKLITDNKSSPKYSLIKR